MSSELMATLSSANLELESPVLTPVSDESAAPRPAGSFPELSVPNPLAGSLKCEVEPCRGKGSRSVEGVMADGTHAMVDVAGKAAHGACKGTRAKGQRVGGGGRVRS